MTYPVCPECKSQNTYHDSIQFVCPDCAYEWNGKETAEEEALIVKDSNGNLLSDGDDVLLIKDLKLKGSSSSKKGSKFKGIRLVQGDHNVDCGKIMLKSEFLKKA